MADAIAAYFGSISDFLYTYIIIALLLCAGVYFTVRTRAVQFSNFGKMVKTIFSSRESRDGGISSFQAFAIGLASRVGTGNIAGVAIALVLGGPGAVFWMWVVALLGMATAFVEATMAQLFKVRWHDGTFRGGPAFYIQRGLGSRKWGVLFAVFLVFSFGISYEMVQANTIAATLKDHYSVSPWITAIVLLVLTGAVVFGGLKRVAKVTEWMAPIMAIVYIAIALAVIVMNLENIVPIMKLIFASAFGLEQGLAGTAGGVVAAMLNGTRRGLFSNEAGEGSAPNAASTAQVSHPVKQGFIQAMGVFVDTILVCSATAFIILNSLGTVYKPGEETSLDGASLTIAAATYELGEWIVPIMVVLILVFCYSSIIGNFAYAEINIDFMTNGKAWGSKVLGGVVVLSVAIGSLSSLNAVWNFADITMAGMAVINLVAIVLLGKWVFGALRDFQADPEKPFVATNNPHMPGELPSDIWVERENAQA
ncbi:alanine/glycine:cation symporter family protein [Arcanobacterium bovis]|uniref:Alanine:cation symporter family protein n=1 Tax=Arcanobacterium bovis TaxID=2529275 RepID=A0A4Q9V140_9ACTO|nr:alanine/glycine:cation symporter family protein [Arcanobacterium bovis]TBW22796.1 alanine:cation symporter family protein [Arcanobacterium bovis]